MARLYLYAPVAARAAALSEQLALWPDLELIVLDHLPPSPQERSPHDLLLADCPEGTAPQPDWPRETLICLGPAGDMPCPLRWSELARCLRLHLTRSDAQEPFDVGSCTCLPLERLLLTEDGSELARLTDKEVHLLRSLSDAGPDGLSREALLEQVWGYRSDLDTHTLETHIYRLRQKIEADPASPALLLTTASGYALAGVSA